MLLEEQIHYDLPKFFVLTRELEEHWSYAGRMWSRIIKFVKEYCPDTESDLLINDVMREFVKPDPAYLIIGYRNDDYDLVGHLLACISIPGWSRKRRCLIMQYQTDEPLPIGIRQAVLDKYVVDWAKTQYCSEIISEVKSSFAPRAGRMFYGFETDLIQLKRAL
jgi:hypothetical protein